MQLQEAMCAICQKIALNVIQKAQTQSRGPVYEVKLADVPCSEQPPHRPLQVRDAINHANFKGLYTPDV